MSKVDKFIKAETRHSKKTDKDYVISIVLVDDKLAEAFGTVREGDEGELSYNEQFKKWEFKKGSFNKSTGKYQADPVKLKQDYNLEVARNQSIQRQVALKGAVDLIVAAKRDYGELTVTFDDLMDLLKPKREVVQDTGDFAKINPDDFVPTEDEEPDWSQLDE